MKVIHGDIDKRLIDKGTACALGFFDGVHRGHQKLIHKLIEISTAYGIKSMVFTFEKHPLKVLMDPNAPELITSNREKAGILKEFGVDIVNFNNVDMDFLNTEPEFFLSNMIDRFNVKAIVAGFNFKFGHLCRGDSSFLKEYGRINNLNVNIIDPIRIDGIIVSSTVIREYIKNGNISMANKFLGRCFSLEGSIIHGMERGRKIGFPTANLSIDKDIIVPKNGVYITEIDIDGTKKMGVTNVGYNPTFNNSYISIETHIIGCSRNVYGKHAIIYFHKRLRDEKVFKDLTGLSKQIDDDKQSAIQYFECLKGSTRNT